MKSYITGSGEQTKNLGRETAKNLSGKRILALYGELGSGKTTFVQGLAEGLGITKRIISPTFVIIRHYSLYPKPYTLYHIDLYRIENEKWIEGLGLMEIINDPENIVAIEWAEKMEKLLPKERINIWFEYISEGERKVIAEITN